MRHAKIYNTTIRDCDGVEHAYSAQLYPFDHGMALKLEILGIVGAPALKGLAAALTAGSIGDMDLDDAASALGAIPAQIVAAGGPALIRRILYGVRRDGGMDDGGKAIGWKRLDSEAEMTAAYSGNWIEMYKALAWALGINYSPFGASGSTSWSDLWSRLVASIKGAMTATPDGAPESMQPEGASLPAKPPRRAA